MREIKFRMWNGVMHPIWYRIDSDGIDEIDILMQYTGLKDKNGKEIYEGDVLEEISFIGERKNRYEVKWIANGFQYIRQNDKALCYEASEYIEIIGNVYENPDLLKK